MKLTNIFTIAILSLVMLAGCGKDEDEGPTLGTLTGIVSDATDLSALADASIVVFNANDNAPVIALNSDVDGNFSTDLEPGNYFVKVARQGFLSAPPRGITAVPFTVTAGATTENDVALYPSDETSIGLISGKVSEGSAGIPGVLVVAENGSQAYSAVSDQDGNYKIFNVAAGTYDVAGWSADYNSAVVSAAIIQDSETTGVDITLTGGATGSLAGQVRNLAAENKDVDVALVHPVTRETIPGLTSRTSGQAYTITNIPAGTYIARATYENDVRVMDPDRIFKFGEPEVTLSGESQNLDFDITGSVSLNSPNNEATTTAPVEVTSTTPTFTWTAYASTSDYVIEVTDAVTGAVIWGGIDISGDQPVKNIEIPGGTTSIDFNSDGNALISQLVIGKVYRWRILASKDDQNSPTGWTLISASEDQRGLIKVVE